MPELLTSIKRMSETKHPIAELERDIAEIDLNVREGRFQRWLALIAGVSSVLSGIEVTYEHYRGSYSRRIMYTPVILSGALAASGVAGFLNRMAARTVLPAISLLTLGDCLIGFYFHVRGIQRKPGGWRLPIVNIIMGPPIFAPLLFGVSAYLGLLAAFLRRSEAKSTQLLPSATHEHHWARFIGSKYEPITWTQDVREGRFQKQMAVATVIATFFSGFEAWYSHYKNNFRYKAQWTPIIISPLLMASRNRRRQKPPCCAHLASSALCPRYCRWNSRFRLSRARRLTQARRYKKTDLQHHLWSAAVCAFAVRREWLSWIAGQSTAEREMKMSAQTAMIDKRPINPEYGIADRTNGSARVLSGIQHAEAAEVLGR